MLGKRPPPLMKKLSELLLLGGSGRAGALDASTSPRSPLDFKNLPPSPRYDLAGVGLGIVAALGHEAQPKYCISSHRPAAVSGAGAKMGPEDWDMESETFTYVTRHGPAGKSFTEVYYDACEYGGVTGREANRDFRGGRRDSRRRSGGDQEEEEDKALNFPTLDFLSSCHLCGKKLHGRDIYMYRGDKAFCSPECRSRQMASDERKERCKAEASKSRTTSADVSSSPYNRDGNIFFSAGILAI